MGRLFFILAILFASLQSNSQSIVFSPKNPLTYVYRLDSARAAMVFQRNVFDTPWLFTEKVDSFSSGIPKLNPGVYLFATYREPGIYWQVKTVPLANIQTLAFNGIIQVRLFDTSYHEFSGPRLFIDRKEIKMDTSCHCFEFKRNKKDRNYYLSSGESFMMGKIPGDYKTYPATPRESYGGNHVISHGYFILNQPKYQPKDSVKLKAFILKPSGSAFTKPLKLYLVNYQPYQRVLLATVRPQTRGAYVYEFRLADTLKIDRSYRLEFEDNDRTILMHTEFVIEEYKLRNNTYEAHLDKRVFHKGEQVKIFVGARDANDLPLTDARVRVRIRLNSFDNFKGKYLFIPDEWKEKIYETFTELDISGETEITVPAASLPEMDMGLTAEISFSDAAGELNQTNLPFQVLQEQSYFDFDYAYGNVHATYIENGQLKNKKAILKGYLGNRLIVNDTITLPFINEVDPVCDRYLLFDSNDIEIGKTLITDLQQLVNAEGIRTHDSIFIRIQNPAKVLLYYRIYRGDELYKAGSTRNLDFMQADTSLYSYNLVYFFYIQGAPVVREEVYTFKDKEFSIRTNLPEVIYPGQTCNIDIRVLNSQRLPQSDVNLTAFGVNAHFDNLQTPELQYYGNYKDRILLLERSSLTNFPIQDQQYYLPKVQFTTLLVAGMVKMADYRLRYPNELFFVQKVPIHFAMPEFIPFVVAGGKRQEIYSMAIDQKLAYVKGDWGCVNGFSFLVTSGKHTLTVRTKTSLFELPAIDFEDSFRYVLSFDTLCLPAGIIKTSCKSHLGFDSLEMEEIKSQLFVFNPGNWDNEHGPYLISQGMRVLGSANRLFTNFNGQQQPQYIFGPLRNDTVSFYEGSQLVQKILFQPGKKYLYFRERIISEPIDSVYVPFDFRFFKANDESFQTLYDTAFRIIEPEVKQVVKEELIHKPKTEVNELCYFRYHFEPEPKANSEKSLVRISGLTDAGVRHLMLFHQGDEMKSILNPQISSYQNTADIFLDTGFYRIYICSENNNLAILGPYEIPAAGMVILHLDSSDFTYDCGMLNLMLPEAKRLQEIYTLRESMQVSYRKQDYVEVREKSAIQMSHANEKSPVLSGYVFDKYGVALDQVIVTLEQSGKVRGISFSDVSGGFLIRDLPAGDYQLRFTRYGSCVTILNNVRLVNSKIHQLSVKLGECGFGTVNGTSAPTLFFGKSNINKEDYQRFESSKEPLIAGFGMIKGKIVDASTKAAMDFVNISIKKNGVKMASALSDDNGEFFIKNLQPGKYELLASFVGYRNIIIEAINVSPDEIRFVNFSMEQSTGTTLQEVSINYKRQLVDPGGVRGNTTTSKDIISYSSRSSNTMAYATLGVESRSGATPNFRGARADGAAYYIDGIRVAGVSNLPANAIGDVGGTLENQKTFEKEQQLRLFSMTGNAGLSGTRSNFRDYAFWVPNLITDRNGEAHMNITFPDNITRWRSFVLAMDESFNTKVYVHDTRSYKPLSASLLIPAFAIQGDRIRIKGKISNYTGLKIGVETSFSFNDTVLSSSKSEVEKSLQESAEINPETKDTIVLSYQMKTDMKYEDGEKYKLPVLPDGIEQKSFEYYHLHKDTSFSFRTGIVGDYSLTLINSYTQLMREEILRLREYHYGCTEQTASKLNALLVEKRLCAILGDSFKQEKLVRFCINRLETMQQSDGSWGWFGRSASELWLTYYVMQTMLEAKSVGFHSKATERGISYIKKNIQSLSSGMQIKAFDLLFQARVEMDYQKYLSTIEEDKLSFTDRLLVTRLKQRMELPHFSGFIFYGIQKDNEGNIFWNQNFESIYQNKTTASLLAYEILRDDLADSSILAGIRQYFFSERYFGSNRERNTLESALILRAMAGDLAGFEKGNLHSSITINGRDAGNKFPIKINLQPDMVYQIHKSGAKVRMFVMKKSFEKNPETDTLHFKIRSGFIQDGKRVGSIKQGIPVIYEVQVTAINNSEFIMVQIPIPASCNYLNKSERYGADEIEYHKDRVILFYRKVSKGKKVFRIELEPRFEGNFSVLPVQVENMYDPEIRGYNKSAVVEVGGW